MSARSLLAVALLAAAVLIAPAGARAQQAPRTVVLRFEGPRASGSYRSTNPKIRTISPKSVPSMITAPTAGPSNVSLSADRAARPLERLADQLRPIRTRAIIVALGKDSVIPDIM